MFLKRNPGAFCRRLSGRDSNHLLYRLPRKGWASIITVEFVADRLCVTAPLNFDRPLKLLQRSDTLVIRLALFQPDRLLVRGLADHACGVSLISCTHFPEMTT